MKSITSSASEDSLFQLHTRNLRGINERDLTHVTTSGTLRDYQSVGLLKEVKWIIQRIIALLIVLNDNVSF